MIRFQADNQFRTQNEAPTMVWARKKDTSEEMSYLVDQTLRIIGITPKAVEKHLAKLKAEGIIKRDGPDKGGSWTVL